MARLHCRGLLDFLGTLRWRTQRTSHARPIWARKGLLSVFSFDEIVVLERFRKPVLFRGSQGVSIFRGNGVSDRLLQDTDTSSSRRDDVGRARGRNLVQGDSQQVAVCLTWSLEQRST